MEIGCDEMFGWAGDLMVPARVLCPTDWQKVP